MTCGAVMRRAAVASIVNPVKVIRQSRSSTIAANFQSFSIASSSSSAFSLSVSTRSSFRIMVSSLIVPDGRGVTFSGSKKGSSLGDIHFGSRLICLKRPPFLWTWLWLIWLERGGERWLWWFDGGRGGGG